MVRLTKKNQVLFRIRSVYDEGYNKILIACGRRNTTFTAVLSGKFLLPQAPWSGRI